jgi:tryptophan 2,3-dioxygenase
MQQGVLNRVMSNPDISASIKNKAASDFELSLQSFTDLFMYKGTDTFSNREMAAGLFILLYKEYPVLRLPFEVIHSLTEIDEQMSTWRYRHYSMVRKMIGTRPGTGGSPGAAYLSGALQQNTIFNDLTLFPTYFMEKHNRPELPEDLKQYLSFVQIG